MPFVHDGIAPMMQRDMSYNHILDLNGVYITLNLVVLDSLPFFFFLNLHYQRQMVQKIQEILVNTGKKTVFYVTLTIQRFRHRKQAVITPAKSIHLFLITMKKTKHNGKDETKTTPLGVRLLLFVT